MSFSKHLNKLMVCVGSGLTITGIGAVYYKKVRNIDNKANTLIAPDRDRQITNNDSILKDMKLLSVQVFFRHGARMPLRNIAGVEEVSSNEIVSLTWTLHVKSISLAPLLKCGEGFIRCIFQLNYDSKTILSPVPHTHIPHKVVDLETGGARPDSGIEATYTSFKVNHITCSSL